VSFSSATPSVCSVSGSTVSFVGAGGCTIDANQTGNGEYEPAPATTQSFSVAKASQTIAYTSTAPSNASVGGPPYAVTATGGGSGNPVVFSSGSPSTCAVSGSTVSFVGAGTCTIDANQSGNENYNAAAQEQQSFSVGAGSQTITFTSTAPSNATVGGPAYTVTATGGGSGNPVVFSSGSPSTCTVSGSTVSFVGAGTCTVDANQVGNANFNAAPQAQQSFAVAKVAQTITFKSTPPNPATVGGTYNVEATASSGLAVSFSSATPLVCTVSGSTVTLGAAGECTIDANQAGNESYEPAPQAQQSFAVTQRAQKITLESSPPSPANVGGVYNLKASSSSGLAVSFSSATPSVCTVSGSTASFIHVGECTIDFNQAGNGEYEPAPQVAQSFQVGRGAQAITFTSTAPNGATVGGPPYTVTTTGGGSGNPVTLTIDAASKSICTISASTVSFTAAGTCTIDANQAGTADYEAAPQVQQSFTVHQLAQTVTFTSSPPAGAVAGGAAYTVTASASSGLAVSFSSGTPLVCTVSGSTVTFGAAGECTIDADQAGNAEYAPAPTVQQSFAVAAAPVPPTSPPKSPPPIAQVKPVVVADSSFRVIGASLSLSTYAITFVESVANPGTFTWVMTFENGKFGVYTASTKRCKTGFVRLMHKCRPAKVLFAKGSETVSTTGSVTFTVKPTRAGVSALRKAFKHNKGLPVTANVTYQSSHGGASVTRVQSLVVRGRR
jgi:hypothetical protein